MSNDLEKENEQEISMLFPNVDNLPNWQQRLPILESGLIAPIHQPVYTIYKLKYILKKIT